MSRLGVHPEPKKRYHGGRWRIYWKWDSRQYSVATKHVDQKKTAAVSVDLRLFSAALTMERPVFPEAYQTAPAVVAYMQARFPEEEAPAAPDSVTWLEDYAQEIKGECSPKWAAMSVTRLHALNRATGGLTTLTPEAASKYIAGIASKQEVGTRNRILATFSRFYKWAIRTGRTQTNPFAGIKTLKEEKLTDIIYCTPAERDEAIAFAKATGWEEWLALPIAFYAGMRREEIVNLTWPNVRFEAAQIVVVKTKTSKSRTIPLNATLEQYLRAVPEAERRGHVVKCPPDIDDLRDTLIDRPYQYAMPKILHSLKNGGMIPDESSLNFNLYFYHYPQRYLDAIVPALHPLGVCLLCSPEFMEIAEKVYRGDGTEADACRFIIACETAARVYTSTCALDNERVKQNQTGSKLKRPGSEFFDDTPDPDDDASN